MRYKLYNLQNGKGIQTWDCENPNLYTLKLELINPQKQVSTSMKSVNRIPLPLSSAPKDGIYINGTKFSKGNQQIIVFILMADVQLNRELMPADAPY